MAILWVTLFFLVWFCFYRFVNFLRYFSSKKSQGYFPHRNVIPWQAT